MSRCSTTSWRSPTSTTAANRLPQQVRALAEDPTAHAPCPPGFKRILTDGYCLFFGPGEDMTMVQRLRLAPGDVEPTVEAVREEVRARERSLFTWWVTDSSRPADLEQRLIGLGMEPAAMPIHEPEYAAMVLVQPPDMPPGGVEARQVSSYEEYVTAWEIGAEAFRQTEEQRESARRVLRQLYELHEQGISATYLAFVDRRPVAMASAVFADAGVMLLGGAVGEKARGRGCYRALVQARWEDAVERGTPALVVQAGEMSRPILERLGFERVATMRPLVDRLA